MPSQGNDVFISYARESGSHLAQLVRARLEERGLRVFLDVHSLNAGRFDEVLRSAIERTPNFLLLLTPGSLARIGDPENWVRKELTLALDTRRTIVPLRTESFQIPDEASLPDELKPLLRFHMITYSHEYSDESLSKVISMLRRPPMTRSRRLGITVGACSVVAVAGVAGYLQIQDPRAALPAVSAIVTAKLPNSALQPPEGPDAVDVNEVPWPVQARAPANEVPWPMQARAPAMDNFKVFGSSDGEVRVVWSLDSSTTGHGKLVERGMGDIEDSIAALYSRLYKLPRRDVSIAANTREGWTYRVQFLGSTDARYDGCSFDLDYSAFSVNLWKSGEYAKPIPPDRLGVDWKAIMDDVARILAIFYNGTRTPRFGPVRINSYKDGSWHYEVKYVLQEVTRVSDHNIPKPFADHD